MLREFTTGMQLVNASLQAGYAVENAFRESLPELKKKASITFPMGFGVPDHLSPA